MDMLRFGIVGLGVGVTLLASGCSDSTSGECLGDIDPAGQVYQLKVYNCTRGDLTVRVNERDVGTVTPYNDDSEECGVTDLGSFPQCSTGVIKAYGNYSYSQEIQWNADAMAASADGCLVVGQVYDPSSGIPSRAYENSTCKLLEVHDSEEE